MEKLIISLLGLPASGKNLYGEQFAQEHGFKFVGEVASELIHEKKFQIGVNAPFEFDNIVLMKNKKLVHEIMNSKDKKIVLEGGPVLDMLYLEGRMKFGKYKEERRRLLDAYQDPLFKKFFDQCSFVLFSMPPQISLSRQEERNKPEFATTDPQLLDFVSQSLLKMSRENGDKVIVINLMGKTKEEIYQEFENKVLSIK